MISVVVPCYNEEAVLPALKERLTAAADSWKEDYEVILVDDGSTDGSWEIEKSIHEEDPRWKLLRFARNFGHQTAVSAGIHHCGGDCVIIIDGDLQDPPEILQQFIAKWREGFEVVYAVRRKRKEGILKRICYAAFYRLLDRIAEVKIPLDSGDFCLMDRKVIDRLKAMPEHNRFVRGLRSWVGFRQAGIEYERDARAAGEPKYGLRKLMKLAFDGMLSFSKAPLRIAAYLGIAVCMASAAVLAYSLCGFVFSIQFARWGLLLPTEAEELASAIIFVGGVQLIVMGIIGEYLGRIYDEVRRRPNWVVSESLGLSEPGE